MTVDDLKAFHGSRTYSELADKMGVTKGAVSKWRSKGIPHDTQARFQILSKNKLKADLSAQQFAKTA
jgi:transcriptional regulator with XRE-family HTH domain